MGEANVVQIVVTALLSSGLMGGLITLFSKKVWSPESKNDLARIGNEFAHILLAEARTEREELRTTIKELEDVVDSSRETIHRLEDLAHHKDQVIRYLEDRQAIVARKIKSGELVSLTDIFGSKPKAEFQFALMREQEESKKNE